MAKERSRNWMDATHLSGSTLIKCECGWFGHLGDAASVHARDLFGRCHGHDFYCPLCSKEMGCEKKHMIICLAEVEDHCKTNGDMDALYAIKVIKKYMQMDEFNNP